MSQMNFMSIKGYHTNYEFWFKLNNENSFQSSNYKKKKKDCACQLNKDIYPKLKSEEVPK